MPSFPVALKTLFQLGPEPMVLFALYKLGLKTRYYLPMTDDGSQTTGRDLSSMLCRHLFTLPPRTALLTALGDSALAALFTEADQIAEGKIRLFGGDLVPLQLSFSGPLQHWTAYETGKTPLPPLNDCPSDLPNTDLKFIWEPARFGWAFVLGRACHISGKEKYAQAFWRHTETFLDANPPCLGPHWMNGQEIALRLMAFVWAAQVFAASPASTPKRLIRLSQSIAQHAQRVAQTLIYARAQNNNHLVSEAAALYTAGLALPGHPQSGRWRALGWRWLNRAFQDQIGSYGEYIQHSANYHRLMLHCALWVNAIKADVWPRTTFDALGRASAWLFSILDIGSGQTPNLGANDGALVLHLAACTFSDYRPTVQAAARAFLHTGLPSGPWDEMALWLDLPVSGETLEPNDYLSDNLHGKESWAYLRTTTFKSRLGHMDQLHLDLWWRGLNVAQDAGSYCYNALPPWDNPLVSSRVHNTVTLDGRDQMTRAGRFMTLDWFPAYAKTLLESDERILQKMTAWCKTSRIRHERTVTVYVDGHWTVADKLVTPGKRTHTFRLHWLLPDWEWDVEKQVAGTSGSCVIVRMKSPHGPLILRLIPDFRLPESDLHLTIIRAGEVVYGNGLALPFEGWVSPTYGCKVPALSLALECTARESMTFLSEFVFPAA